MAVYTLIVGKDLNEDTLISQIFDNRTTMFFVDFKITSKTSARTSEAMHCTINISRLQYNI